MLLRRRLRRRRLALLLLHLRLLLRLRLLLLLWLLLLPRRRLLLLPFLPLPPPLLLPHVVRRDRRHAFGARPAALGHLLGSYVATELVRDLWCRQQRRAVRGRGRGGAWRGGGTKGGVASTQRRFRRGGP